jgi:hypothetical protein
MTVASTDKTASGIEGPAADWIGTLKRGASFTLGTNPDTSLRFVKGVDYPLDDATKVKLEEKAIDVVDMGTEDDAGDAITEDRCKFDFRRVGETPKAAPRRRVRAV